MGTHTESAILACRATLHKTLSDIASTLAENIARDLKPGATDREKERLAEALEFFLG